MVNPSFETNVGTQRAHAALPAVQHGAAGGGRAVPGAQAAEAAAAAGGRARVVDRAPGLDCREAARCAHARACESPMASSGSFTSLGCGAVPRTRYGGFRWGACSQVWGALPALTQRIIASSKTASLVPDASSSRGALHTSPTLRTARAARQTSAPRCWRSTGTTSLCARARRCAPAPRRRAQQTERTGLLRTTTRATPAAAPRRQALAPRHPNLAKAIRAHLRSPCWRSRASRLSALRLCCALCSLPCLELAGWNGLRFRAALVQALPRAPCACGQAG